METRPQDPDRRTRLFRALGISALLALLIGALSLASRNRKQGWTWDVLKDALPEPIGYAAVSFWILFAILFFCYVRKSAATLEYQERVRRDERL